MSFWAAVLLLFAFDWILLSLMLWDYGILEWWKGIPVGLIGPLITRLLQKQDNNPLPGAGAIRMWVYRHLFGNTYFVRFAASALIAVSIALATYYVSLPPLKVHFQVADFQTRGVDGEASLSLPREPYEVKTNASGYGFLQVPGLNLGVLSFSRITSTEKRLELKQPDYRTTFAWRHRFQWLKSPLLVFVREVPPIQTSDQRAQVFRDEAVKLINQDQYEAAQQKLKEALQLPDLGPTLRSELQKLLTDCQVKQAIKMGRFK